MIAVPSPAVSTDDTPAPPTSVRARLGAWLAHNWWPLCIFAAALAVRAHWNLAAHPIGEFMYSDMNGYNGRAEQILDAPTHRGEYRAFFPFGTQWLLAGVKFVFGRDNYTAIGLYHALLGSLTAVFTYGIARRATRHAWVPPVVGLFMVIYYPLISLGGYILSETPSAFFMTAATLLLLRVVQEGQNSDAWLLGVAVAVGTLVRPQLMLTAALVVLFWTAMRGHYPRLNWGHLLRAAVPVVLALGLGSARLYWHTERIGGISENGAVNLTFGRCHNKGIYTLPDGKGHGRIRFSPPPLIQLERYSKKYPERLLSLDPVFGDHPEPVEGLEGFEVDGLGCRTRDCFVPGGEIQFVGYMGDKKALGKVTRSCIRRSGLRRQLWFSFTHVVQLWAVNDMWPDQANPKPHPRDPKWGWNRLSRLWRYVHNSIVLFPALLGLGFIARAQKRPEMALVSLNVWALLLVAAIYIGGIRFRIPYDPFLIVLAFEVWATLGAFVWHRLWSSKGTTTPGSNAGGDSLST